MDKRKPIVVDASRLTRHRMDRGRGPLSFTYLHRRVFLCLSDTLCFELTLRCRCQYRDGKFGYYYRLRHLSKDEIEEVLAGYKSCDGSAEAMLAMLLCLTFDDAVRTVEASSQLRELVYDRTPEDDRDEDFHEKLTHLEKNLKRLHDDLDRLEMSADFITQLIRVNARRRSLPLTTGRR